MRLHRVLSATLILALFACPSPASADLDVVFVLDTTGSMGGELREVQERVRQLALSLAEIRADERIRYGIVAYRDRGDAYVTRIFDLDLDVSAAAAFLDSLTAGGGGDGPESVVAALAKALWEISWDRDDRIERQIFLIGDAPPHLDYDDEPTPEQLIEEARRARIVINTIGCRSLPPKGVSFFRNVAYQTEGSYQHIGRVTQPGAGTVTEAVSRSVSASAAPSLEVGVSWLTHRDGESPGILVRQGGPVGIGQSRDGDALAPCTLEVRLPRGFALEIPPRVWIGGDSMVVELQLVDGPGGIDLYSLSECPPRTTPIDVVIGGGS